MNISMLVIDSNITVSEKEQAEWLKHGISTVRVNTMQEAIKKLTEEAFLFTAINADSTNYLPLLKVMRETAATFIIITTSDYTPAKEVQALYEGADVFSPFNESAELNVQLALCKMLRCKERDKPPSKPDDMIIYEKFLILSDLKRIFYGDTRLSLKKKEYEILHYLICNHDLPVSYDAIYKNIWGRDYDKSGHKSLWDYISKLRKILKAVSSEKEYIITERDSGYRFSAANDK